MSEVETCEFYCLGCMRFVPEQITEDERVCPYCGEETKDLEE